MNPVRSRGRNPENKDMINDKIEFINFNKMSNVAFLTATCF